MNLRGAMTVTLRRNERIGVDEGNRYGTYETDIRRDPAEDDHNRRLGAFKGGWTKAVQGEKYGGVLDAELTWDDLGWRLGKIFGETEEERIEELFE